MEAVETGELDRAVVTELDQARRAMGDDGHFGARPNGKRNGRVEIDSQTIERLEAASDEAEPTPGEMTVSGRLHFIEVEEPERVAIRDASGVNWICSYAPELERTVLGLVKALVLASGTGARTSARTGKLHLREIAAVPTYDQSSLFTWEHISVEELEREHGIRRPQGLAAVSDPQWTDDDQDRAYLAFLLGDDHPDE